MTNEFRGNPNASTFNNIRLGFDPDADVAIGTDSGNADGSTFDFVTGVQYTGKDGQSKTINLFREERPTGQRVAITVASNATGPELQSALHRLINSHETAPIVAVTKTGDTFAIEHTGPGTLSAIVTDAGTINLTRTANAAVVTGTDDEPVDDPVAAEDGVDLNDDDVAVL